MADLLLAPYLAGADEVTVGDWQLLRFSKVEKSDAVPDALRPAVARLVEAYKIEDGAGLGVVIYPRDGAVGDEIDRASLRPLRRALLAGTVAGNPRMAVAEDEQDGNAGWGTVAAENALIWGHPNLDPRSYAIETGMLVRVTSLRHAEDDEPLPNVAPPVELPKPMMAKFDAEIADATARLLAAGDAAARRLLLALDWYAVALSNSEAVTVEVRIGAARSALEVLTDAGDESKKVVRAYGELMREEETEVATYTSDDVFWARGDVQLTADAWWLTRLSQLRNTIVHGDELDEDLWHHDGHHHLNQIHDRLIAGLRVVVADGIGDAALRAPPGERVWIRAAEEARQHLARRAEDGEDGNESVEIEVHGEEVGDDDGEPRGADD